jgi:hypothetical protein
MLNYVSSIPQTGQRRLSSTQQNWLTHPLPPPSSDLGMAVVIPCHAEPDLLSTLNSLKNAAQPTCAVEVIWVFNASTQASEDLQSMHSTSLAQIQAWQAEQAPWFELILLNAADLPPKHAGVGLARRIGMDLACERLFSLSRQDAPIICLDADCTVAPSYFQALERHFYSDYPKSPACSLAFAHPLKGALPDEIYTGILRYELYLRYYVQGLRHADLPYAFHTIGSSMAVRAGVYRAQGGMNRRKAGEDFYFLHKIMPLGGFSQLENTTVYPSPRISDRVPFGTGRAMGQWLQSPDLSYPVYHPQSFDDIKAMVTALSGLYPLTPDKQANFIAKLSAPLQDWFRTNQGPQKLNEIQANSSSERVFRQRFFRWFDGFGALKLVHYLRDQAYSEIPLASAAQTLAQWRGLKSNEQDLDSLLKLYRALDRQPWQS